MDQLFEQMLTSIQEHGTLHPLPIADDLREIRRLKGMFRLKMYNWKMEKVRKISVMRATLRIPSLEIFALEIYPEADYDLPLLAIDFSCMKKKTFVYINFIPLAASEAYHKKYIEGLKPLHEACEFGKWKPPRQWMTPYLNPCTVHNMVGNPLLGKIKGHAKAVLSLYLKMLSQAKKIDQAAYRHQIAHACSNYLEQLSTQDQSRKMLGRLIGRSRADRIFMEVIR